jgi:CHAT domain-containing protein
MYGTNTLPRSQLSEFVISSYTPTLTALLDDSSSTPSQEFQLLAVAQPNAYGQSHLPNTQEELQRIYKHAGSLKVLSLVGSDATVEKVVRGMKGSSWVHFACHGVQDMANPTESALLLAGSSHMKLSEIIKLSLPCAGLAFLSACQTATGAEELPEEAVHLAAGMLLAGYGGVIATMWSIMDRDAPCVADDVYAHLFKDQTPDHTQAAYALHHAIQKLRRTTEGKSYFSWVPYIHMGA